MAEFDFLDLGKTRTPAYNIPGSGQGQFGYMGNLQQAAAVDPLTVSPAMGEFSMINRNYLPVDTSSIAGGAAIAGPTWWDRAFGGTDPTTGKTTGGFVAPALGALSAGMNFYTGKKQLGLAEDQLATQKKQFADQFNIQKQLINRDIQEQGERRFARNPALNVAPEEYYKQHRIA